MRIFSTRSAAYLWKRSCAQRKGGPSISTKSCLRLLSRFGLTLKALARGQWRYLIWRAGLSIRGVDVGYASAEKLGLPPSSANQADTPGPELKKVMRMISISSESRIIDFGCGKGAAIITMAKFPFSEIAGCDLSPELLGIAERNLLRLGIKGVNLYCCNATQFTELDNYSHVYFYNPFLPDVMKCVLDNIVTSLTRNPRRLTIIYKNPQCHNMIIGTGIFDKVREFDFGTPRYYIYASHISSG
jgi:hypothetical protein